MDATTPTIAKQLPLGIHFNLPEDQHHADEGLGSSKLRLLRRNPTSFWKRHIDPNRSDKKSTRGQTRGTALHKLLFAGEAAFDETYMRGPDQTDMTTAEKSASTKASNLKAAALNKIALKAADYDQVAISRVMVLKNPELATVFINGFPEVSIFWERDGVRRKARIDYLKIRGIGDLKGVDNDDDMDFEEKCRMHIQRFRYDLQCGSYMEARALIPRMVADGMVYGDHDATLLKKVAVRDKYAWQWVFYAMAGAPDVWSYTQSPGNPMIAAAQRDVEIAVSRFVRFKERFGDTQWVLAQPPKELTFEMMPPWFNRTTPEEMAEYDDWMNSKGPR